MASRKFVVGDRVRLSLDTSATHDPRDAYTISRILPAEANVWQYRVKREGDGLERAVSESQLVNMNVAPGQTSNRTEIETQRETQRIRNANALGRARSAARRH